MAVEVKYVVIREGERENVVYQQKKPMLMTKCLIRRICDTG